jgi:hypothetical protein
MTRSELVKRAISFEGPFRVPVWFWNEDRERSDIHSFELFPYKGDVKTSEWGYVWEDLGDGTIGQPKKPVIPTWDDFDAFAFPVPDKPGRFRGIEEFERSAEDRYRAAEMGITGFNTYTFLRGFENTLVDFKLERYEADVLLDRIFEFETEVIRLASAHGFDAIHFADDWGTQQSLIIDPDLWRSMFKPRYKRQFDTVHELGMHVWFHCCGNIKEIIPDFHEMGVDVMNISQPNAIDIGYIGRALRGRQCFMVPISYQTVSISGSPMAIRQEAERLYRALGTSEGGFIGYVEEYSIMGMSEDNYRACAAAFENLM